MHLTDPSRWKHGHDFTADFATAEKKSTRRVLMLTAAMMIAEIIFGLKFHSMALFADGLHMGTHVAAFLITVLAYFFARRHASDASFSFGTGKFGVLGAFTSAIVLGGVGLVMAGESIGRLIRPLPIQFNQAIVVACLGLAVNVASALILKDDSHGHHHDHHHDGLEQSHDLNLRSAYLHVIADGVTSLLAIAALLSGKLFGWYWMDALMGLVGSGVIGQWAYSLLRQTTVILLDRIPAGSDLPVVIREGVENDGDSLIADLHIWQVAVNKFAAIIRVVAHHPKAPEEYRQALKIHEELVHVTVETQTCPEQEHSHASDC
jgi:cation diffusion facilitator family transporter